MKKYVIIDDNALSGYGVIENFDNIYTVDVQIKDLPDTLNIAKIQAYLLNGTETFELGNARAMGGGLVLRRVYEKESFMDFNPDLPTKIKFRVILNETAVIKGTEKVETVEQSPSGVRLKSDLKRYLRQYDIFSSGEYNSVCWHRVHDGEILLDSPVSKRIFENFGVINIISELKHYLIGFGSGGEVYYALPARYGVEPNPFRDNFSVKAKWLPVFGQREEYGNFGYFVLKETDLAEAM